MDAFFASVEEVDNPWLKGMPVSIGSDPKGGVGRGVVSTANYKARKYGIRSALPIQKAWQYSEEAKHRGEQGVIFLTPRSGRYKEASDIIFKIVSEYSKHVQVASIDEAYIDLSHLRSYVKAEKVCREIKNRIKKETQLTCSVGIAPNKMVAKISSDIEKPDGLTIVKEGSVLEFLGPLPIGSIPGVGPKTQNVFNREGVNSINDARTFSWEELSDMFGRLGFDLFQKVRGIASSELSEATINKSIGHHETFFEDTNDMKYVFAVLSDMSKKILISTEEKGFKGFRAVTLTIRFSDFETKNRSITEDKVINSEKILYLRAIKLALPFFDRSENPHGKAIRMVGLRVEKFI